MHLRGPIYGCSQSIQECAVLRFALPIQIGIRGPVSAQQLADLERIQTSQRHLLGLINEVLNYAKLGTGSVQFNAEDVPVAEVVTAAQSLVAPQARRKAPGSASPSAATWPGDEW